MATCEPPCRAGAHRAASPGPAWPNERRSRSAERQHAASIGALFTNRGLAVPAERPVGTLPVFASVGEACATAVVAEVANVALYDDILKLGLPYDVRRVFEANRAASLDKHLPAFQRCGPVVITAQ